MAERRSDTRNERETDARMGTNQAGRQEHAGGHGHSVAAWTAVAITLIGSLVLAIAVIIPSLWLGIVGGVLAILGAPVGKIMSTMGFGPHVTLNSAADDQGPGRDVQHGGVR